MSFRPAILDRLFPTWTPRIYHLLNGAGGFEGDAMDKQCFLQPVFDPNHPKHFCLGSECNAWRWDKGKWGWRRALRWLLLARRGHCHHQSLR